MKRLLQSKASTFRCEKLNLGEAGATGSLDNLQQAFRPNSVSSDSGLLSPERSKSTVTQKGFESKGTSIQRDNIRKLPMPRSGWVFVRHRNTAFVTHINQLSSNCRQSISHSDFCSSGTNQIWRVGILHFAKGE
ncbi:unnamed protein product [Polarella glacialis]|uniref:Uncharacterized protein n=1 Tax=Polarella glacialis TaxID=89957 RepID=A0A813KIY5_POLGL|nr:unnamed protein product [Polarella glacialis]